MKPNGAALLTSSHLLANCCSSSRLSASDACWSAVSMVVISWMMLGLSPSLAFCDTDSSVIWGPVAVLDVALSSLTKPLMGCANKNPIKTTIDVMATTCLVRCCMCVRIARLRVKLLVTSFYLFNEGFGWFEGRHIMCRDNNRGVF